MADDSTQAQLDALKTGEPQFLQIQWKALSRKTYPGHLPRSLIVSLLAYQLQATRYGDLTPEAARYLKSIARSGEGELNPERFGADKNRHSTGTVFVREHKGQLHRATKTPHGFEWNGQTFLSLSAIARAITGTNWNGLRFFGVPRAKAARHA